jgi:hypothetical protein
MKISKIYLLIGLLFPSLIFANAKVIGNGGNVVICENAQGQITKAEVLDLFEGHAIYGLNYNEDAIPALAQALKYSDTLSYAGSPVSSKNLSADVRDIYNGLKFLPVGVGLESIPDSGHFIIPKGCRVVQTINYRDWKNIFVDFDVWNVLSETQKAALLLHEAIYAYYREGNFEIDDEMTSSRARLAVATLFSGKKAETTDKISDNKHNSYLRCRSTLPFSDFFYYESLYGYYVAQFRFYFNHPVITRTWIQSNDPKLLTGDLQSLFESGVRLQISFSNEKSGKIYDLNSKDLSSADFSCETWNN